MKRLIILAATLIAGLSACDSLLDKEPLDRVTQFDYFKTRSDLELFSNPFYDNLLDKTPYDEQNDLLVQMTLSDVLYGGDKRTVPNTGGGWSWGNLRRINTLLEYVDQCEDKKAVTEYTALAKFFRAAFYFDKVKRFGDVPWYEVQLGSADEALYKPRDSRELIMTNMIKDIDEAINSGGLTEDISTYRVNKWAALALKARFCLFEGTYRKYHGINLEGHDHTYYLEEAAKAAKTIIDEGPYKLYSTKNPDKDYMMLFAQENASTEEYILAIRNSYEAQVYHNATAYTLLPTQGRPGYTRKFINMYLKKDGTAFTDQEGWQTLPFTEEVKARVTSASAPNGCRVPISASRSPATNPSNSFRTRRPREDRSTATTVRPATCRFSAMPKCCSTMPKPRPNWERSRRTIWLSPSTKSEAGWECGAST